MAVRARGLSLQEFLQLPEEKPALEYIGGVVRQKMSPKLKHGLLQYRLAEHINAVAATQGIALAVPEARTTFAGESHVPDVAVYRWDHIPLDADGEIADESPEPPDLAIEILSPGQRVAALTETCRWYVVHGVDMALLVDPRRRAVHAFWTDGAVEEWQGADRIDIDAVVPGFALTVDELFSALQVRRAPSR